MADKKTTQAASGPPPRKGKAAAAPRAGDEVSTSEFEKLLQQAEGDSVRYVLKLYVTGRTPRATQAVASIRALCEENLTGRYDLEVIDIYQQPEAASTEQIIAAPKLIKSEPAPVRRVVGNLTDRNKVLLSLNLQGGGKTASTRATQWMEVEDHADTRNNMSILLRRSGHDVTPAESASEALARAGAHRFDLVISDLGLPDMSGLDLMRQLREAHGLRGIAVSGYGMEEDIRRSYDAGFINHLTNPIHMEQLRQVIRHCSTG